MITKKKHATCVQSTKTVAVSVKIGMALSNAEQKNSSRRMAQFHSKSQEISKVPFTLKMTSIQVSRFA